MSATGLPDDLRKRIDSMARRIDALTGLKELVGEEWSRVLSGSQWRVIEQSLVAKAHLFRSQLRDVARQFLPVANAPGAAMLCNERLGQLELQLSTSYGVFDTFADVVTQRLSPKLGPLLLDCDALAKDALKRDVPALQVVEDPLVYCDRGFGASTLREGVLFPDGSPNPLPLIQVPYTRLTEPLHLTSVIHEVGHEISVRLALLPVFGILARRVCERIVISSQVGEFYAYWMSELVPDFIGFCAAGLAQPASIKEILALPHAEVFRLDAFDPHPPPYLRVLMAFAWCRTAWGHGPWDDWEDRWRMLYPVARLGADHRAVIKQCEGALIPLAEAMMAERLRVLDGRRIVELYGTTNTHPAQILAKRSYHTSVAEGRIRSGRRLHALRSMIEYSSDNQSAGRFEQRPASI